MYQQPFNQLADELQDFTNVVITKAHLDAPSLRKVLSFIVKVSNVAEQAFQDVLTVLIDIKYLSEEDIQSRKIIELQKQIEFLTVRSKYRDVEEICSRLHHLTDQFQNGLAPLLKDVTNAYSWEGIFGLINEHEGRLINLVHQISWQLKDKIEKLNSYSLEDLKKFAKEQLEAVRFGLDQLRDLSNKILGASGKVGLLELLATNENANALSTLFINKGDFYMSNDNYEIGQAGAVGPGSHAHDMTFNQVWDKSSKNIDLSELSKELTKLRGELSSKATKPEHYVALGEVAAAEKAANEGDGATTMKHLKKAGEWVWDVATKAGVGIAIAAAKTALGI